MPYLAVSFSLVIAGYFADLIQTKGYLTTSEVRKYFTCGGFIAQTIFLMAAGYSMNPLLSVLSITTAVALGAFALSGYG